MNSMSAAVYEDFIKQKWDGRLSDSQVTLLSKVCNTETKHNLSLSPHLTNRLIENDNFLRHSILLGACNRYWTSIDGTRFRC